MLALLRQRFNWLLALHEGTPAQSPVLTYPGAEQALCDLGLDEADGTAPDRLRGVQTCWAMGWGAGFRSPVSSGEVKLRSDEVRPITEHCLHDVNEPANESNFRLVHG